jgi:ferredoxin
VPYLHEVLHDDGILPSRITYPISFRQFSFENVDLKTATLRSMAMSYVPGFVRYAFNKLYNYYPLITPDCKKCLICVKSCPVETIKVGKDGIPVIIKDKCIRCLCCHEMCPHHAIIIEKTALAKLIIGKPSN